MLSKVYKLYKNELFSIKRNILNNKRPNLYLKAKYTTKQFLGVFIQKKIFINVFFKKISFKIDKLKKLTEDTIKGDDYFLAKTLLL